MGELNVARHEAEAPKAIDRVVLDGVVEQCLLEESSHPLHSAARKLRALRRRPRARVREALADHAKAKAEKKRAETGYRARRAGSDLQFAVGQMKGRVARKEQDRQLFFVEDQILPQYRFSERLAVCVNYRWRELVDGPLKHGSITFSHDVVFRPDYISPAPARKPSAAKVERALSTLQRHTRI